MRSETARDGGVALSVTPTELEPFVRQWTTLLTTFKRDGSPVGTPVNLAVEGDRAFFRTYDKAWKTKRIRNDPAVEIAPSTLRGKPIGTSVRGTARLLDGEEDRHARHVIVRKYPLFHGVLIPFGHRLSRYRTMHYEVSLPGPVGP
jgi:uncharacterized protein